MLKTLTEEISKSRDKKPGEPKDKGKKGGGEKMRRTSHAKRRGKEKRRRQIEMNSSEATMPPFPIPICALWSPESEHRV